MSTRYLFAGDHAGPLASGAQYAPGDEVAASAVDLDDPHDQGLVDDGVLIDTQPQQGPKKKENDR